MNLWQRLVPILTSLRVEYTYKDPKSFDIDSVEKQRFLAKALPQVACEHEARLQQDDNLKSQQVFLQYKSVVPL